MIKNISRLEVKVNAKEYHLCADMDSPLSDVKEAIFQFQKYIGHIEDQMKAQQEAIKKEKEESEIKTDLPVTEEVKQG